MMALGRRTSTLSCCFRAGEAFAGDVALLGRSKRLAVIAGVFGSGRSIALLDLCEPLGVPASREGSDDRVAHPEMVYCRTRCSA